jgi:hypothetical protein
MSNILKHCVGCGFPIWTSILNDFCPECKEEFRKLLLEDILTKRNLDNLSKLEKSNV